MLRHLRWELDYANINYNAFARIGPDAVGGVGFRYAIFQRVWDAVFQPWAGAIPPYFDIYCSAQFMVSRDNIRFWPKAFYENLLHFLYSTHDIEGPDLSIFFEHIWTYGAFTAGALLAMLLAGACIVTLLCRSLKEPLDMTFILLLALDRPCAAHALQL